MINYYLNRIRDMELKEISDFQKGCWISVIDPSQEEIDYLAETFNLDKQNLLSGLDKYELPRVEFIEDDIYVVLKFVSSENELQTILIVMGREFFLTLSKGKPNFVNRILIGKTRLITSQKLKSLLRLFSLNNKDFEQATLSIVKLVNSKKDLMRDLTEKDLNELLDHEDILNNFLSSYYYKNLLYQKIIKNVKFYEEDKELLEDLITESQQGLDLCRSSLKTISNLRDHYVILFSNKLNNTIRILTIFTIFINIPTAIFGLYGMNILLPMQYHPLAFKYILLMIIGVWILTIIYFVYKKMI